MGNDNFIQREKLIFLSALADICSCFNYKLTLFWSISQKSRLVIWIVILHLLDICTGKTRQNTQEEQHLFAVSSEGRIKVFAS